jgi:hypothetical protein
VASQWIKIILFATSRKERKSEKKRNYPNYQNSPPETTVHREKKASSINKSRELCFPFVVLHY